MALRPVSELGLQEVTDIAATTPAPAKRSSGRPKRSAASAPPTRPKRSAASAPPTRPEPTPRATHAGRGRSLAAGVGTPILSGAVGVAGSFLLARAVLQRRRG